MWAAQAQPGYSVTRSQRRPAKQNVQVSESAFPTNAPIQQQFTTPSALNLTDLLEPAVDGPPSPGRLRALSNQVKKGFSQNHQPTPSTASLLTLTSPDRRPSWEHALETLTLSRRSSTRSNSSSMPSRDRPESGQAFGKAIFNRSKVKLKRESTATGSSASSMYASEVAPDVVPDRSRAASITKEHVKDQFLPGIFSWRRPSQMAEEAAAASSSSSSSSPSQKRLQISSPFNFQHVTHTQRDHLPNIQRTDSVHLRNDFSTLRASQMPSKGSLKGIQAEELQFANFSSEGLPLREEDNAFLIDQYRRGSLQRSPSRFAVKHTRSEDQLHMAPPRPPRSPPASPKDTSYASNVAQARFSRRGSVPYEDARPLASTAVDRISTTGGFRRPGSLSLQVDTNSPPPTSCGSGPVSPTDTSDVRHSRVFYPSATDNPNWPLACPPANSSSFEIALPDVPEEEEHHYGLPKRSRASMRSHQSTNSSLRGSQSVPALRHIAKHSTSDETVILDSFDLFAAQRALSATLMGEDDMDPLPRDSWEDVIDYCYEHEAEADCDYEWERPSLDVGREGALLEAETGFLARPTSDRYDVPALSPGSHLSVCSAQEAITPTMPLPTTAKSPTRSNFSLPRRDGRLQQQRLLHVRNLSQASSFKESHGFTLSPSMVIPGDYHQEMLAREAELQEADGFAVAIPYEEPHLTMETSQLFLGSRSSASTMASASTRSGYERHISTASTNTDYTRMTMSSTSVNMEDLIPKSDGPLPSFDEPAAAAIPETRSHARSRSDALAPMLSRDDCHNSDPGLGKMHSAKRPVGRGRANTTSLASPPPSGQYALFPNVTSLTGSRI